MASRCSCHVLCPSCKHPVHICKHAKTGNCTSCGRKNVGRNNTKITTAVECKHTKMLVRAHRGSMLCTISLGCPKKRDACLAVSHHLEQLNV